MAAPTTRLAILIDAENAPPRAADGVFERVAMLGDATVRRVYGDISGPAFRIWTEMMAKHGLSPRPQAASTTGKNASDITLVIDAMDILHGGHVDGFCLVSSDGDFTRLAHRIREHGLDFVGVGEAKTPESFKRACRLFIPVEALATKATRSERAADARRIPPPSDALPLLRRAIDLTRQEDGWVPLAEMGQRLARLQAGFDPRAFGRKKLSDLVRSTGAFEMDQSEGRPMRIRLMSALADDRPVA